MKTSSFRFSSLLRFFLIFIFHVSASASIEDSMLHEDPWTTDRVEALLWGDVRSSATIPPEEAFVRTLAVLDYFGVPDEPSSQKFFDDLQGVQNPRTIAAMVPFLDMKGRFSDFSTITQTPSGESVLRVFQDFRSKKVLDYEVRLGHESPRVVDDFHSRLLRAAGNPSSQPLSGLRIALDPGHMGGSPWDERSGKFVRDSQGHELSEGLMVLQVSLLLEERLKALGAEVFITHRGLTPVTSLPYESFDLKPFALRFLRERTLDPWFGSLLSTAPAGPSLYRSFSRHVEFRKIFSESMRWKYFFSSADLEARAQAISTFAPDLTLIIHMDTSDPPGNPNGMNPKGHNTTKAYIPGGFFAEEFASRVDRKFFGRHLLDVRAWQASRDLSRQIVGRIQSRLGIPLERMDGGNSVQVEPGVFARNLALQRQLTGSATSYLECLFYNDREEFTRLSRADHSMRIDGREYSYSERLNTLVEAINEGVLQFVRNYH